jgi:sulfite exporter TauE/SafE
MMIWWTTALVTGLAGSLHCVGMCGPLAMALPVGRLPKEQRALARGLYHAGRLTAYSLLGAIVGTVGQGLLLTGLQRPVSIGAGVLLLIWALSARALPGWINTSPMARRLMAPLAALLRQPTLPHMAGLGFLNGLLPCGSVYVALAGALATTSAVGGAGYLLAFGVGTLPAMLSVNLVVSHLTPRFRQRLGRGLPLATLLVALLLIVRGIGLPAQATHTGTDSPIPVCHGTPSM